MNEIYYQMVHTLKCIFKDKRPLILKLLTIIIVILVLGSAFQNEFSSESLGRVRVAYLNEDEDSGGDVMIQSLLASDDVKEWMDLVEVENFEEGQHLAGDSGVDDDEKICAMIYIPKDFTDKYQSAESNVITIYCGKTSQVEATVVKCVFDTFASTINLNSTLEKNFNVSIDENFTLESGIEIMPMLAVGKPDSMGYYAVAMLMMVLIFGAEYGCSGIAEDYLGVVGERIKTTPLKPQNQYIGKLLGLCLASVIQGLFIVAFTGILYGANWGNNYPMILLIIFAMSCAATAIGALVCMITRNQARGSSIVSIIVIACTFLAGGFVKADMGALKYISPNYYAQTSMFNTIYNGDMNVTYLYIGVLFIITVVAGVLAVFLSRRKNA